MAQILVTGGAGFIGTNLVDRLLREGHQVRVLDNLSRPGSKVRLAWLQIQHDQALSIHISDVSDIDQTLRAVKGVERIYHLAGQVAVTESVRDPRADFEANAAGTLNVLEAARQAGNDPIVVFSSTNKVYGNLEARLLLEGDTRYTIRDAPLGLDESSPIDFHSPYGCSKGTGDQYTRDYFRIYGLRTVVLRQSCVYGPWQFGNEDQGWLAWLMVAALRKRPITIFGDGKQVRDILFISDLLDAYEAAIQSIGISAGQIYNIGGGPGNTLSIWFELRPILEELAGRSIPAEFADWRPGDQRVYVSDVRKAKTELNWTPNTLVSEGLQKTFMWLQSHLHLIEAVEAATRGS